MRLQSVCRVVVGVALLLGAACSGRGVEMPPLTLEQAVAAALARDALVRDAQQSLEEREGGAASCPRPYPEV